MILSTTPTIEGHPIREYRGVVTGETIIGTNFVKDFSWSFNGALIKSKVQFEKGAKEEDRPMQGQ